VLEERGIKISGKKSIWLSKKDKNMALTSNPVRLKKMKEYLRSIILFMQQKNQ
jgi:hypothetical protein